MTDSLAHKSSRGVLVTLGGFLSRSVVQFGSVVILSRLLAPEDFGLLAMIMAIGGVVDLIRDFGLTGAILQRKEVSERDWSGLMWLSTGVGLLLTLIVAGCAPLIAALYDEPRLIILTLVGCSRPCTLGFSEICASPPSPASRRSPPCAESSLPSSPRSSVGESGLSSSRPGPRSFIG